MNNKAAEPNAHLNFHTMMVQVFTGKSIEHGEIKFTGSKGIEIYSINVQPFMVEMTNGETLKTEREFTEFLEARKIQVLHSSIPPKEMAVDNVKTGSFLGQSMLNKIRNNKK